MSIQVTNYLNPYTTANAKIQSENSILQLQNLTGNKYSNAFEMQSAGTLSQIQTLTSTSEKLEQKFSEYKSASKEVTDFNDHSNKILETIKNYMADIHKANEEAEITAAADKFLNQIKPLINVQNSDGVYVFNGSRTISPIAENFDLAAIANGNILQDGAGAYHTQSNFLHTERRTVQISDGTKYELADLRSSIADLVASANRLKNNYPGAPPLTPAQIIANKTEAERLATQGSHQVAAVVESLAPINKQINEEKTGILSDIAGEKMKVDNQFKSLIDPDIQNNAMRINTNMTSLMMSQMQNVSIQKQIMDMMKSIG